MQVFCVILTFRDNDYTNFKYVKHEEHKESYNKSCVIVESNLTNTWIDQDLINQWCHVNKTVSSRRNAESRTINLVIVESNMTNT